jgi:type II secretion system protein G
MITITPQWQGKKGAKPLRAFTLIELLIVVAIIAILASIVVPNFLEAQVRAKVTRAQSDMRTIATGLESYRTDWNNYPPTPMDAMSSRVQRLAALTTPVAYLTTVPMEVFRRSKEDAYPYWSAKLSDAMKYSPIYYHLSDEKNHRGRWALFGRGPDMDYEAAPEEEGGGLLMHYDATNGTTSNGDVMRFGP